MIGYKYSITNKPWLIILLRFITNLITVYYGTAAFQLLYFPIASNGHLHSDPRPVGIQGRAHKNCDESAWAVPKAVRNQISCKSSPSLRYIRDIIGKCWQRYLKIARNALRRARAQPLDILLRINYVLLRIWDGFALGTLSPWWTS